MRDEVVLKKGEGGKGRKETNTIKTPEPRYWRGRRSWMMEAFGLGASTYYSKDALHGHRQLPELA